METELRDAISRQELRLYYQPAYSLADATIGSVEALLRWDRPARGILAPSEFIAVAERSDLIVELGGWAIEEVCRQLGRWRTNLEQAELYVAVNISRAQLERGDPVGTLRAAAQRSGAPLSRLALEISAPALAELPTRDVAQLGELREMGATVVVDNVADPPAIAEPAAQLPVRALRIAGSLVAGLPDAQACVTLAREVIDAAASLKADTVAQGVEAPAQVQALRDLGCDYAAGFLFSLPMPADLLQDTLRGQVRPAGGGESIRPAGG
jgi:EAL domain-containing protein (putative c-di-GMP-specific phosphodiesterase class I)